jgi:hypothetical protein
MEGVDYFDSSLFGVAQTETLLMDPQHRALLEMLMHARASDDCTLPIRSDNLDGNGCDSTVGRSQEWESTCGSYYHVGVSPANHYDDTEMQRRLSWIRVYTTRPEDE